MTGIGDIYFECYPLSVFLNFGIPFGTFVLILSCIPLWLVKGIKKKNSYYGLFMMIIFSYYTNSLFEGLAPVGPGAKCYFLWLLAGILYKNKSVEQWFFGIEFLFFARNFDYKQVPCLVKLIISRRCRYCNAKAWDNDVNSVLTSMMKRTRLIRTVALQSKLLLAWTPYRSITKISIFPLISSA